MEEDPWNAWTRKFIIQQIDNKNAVSKYKQRVKIISNTTYQNV